jgi:lipoate---protein ligase
MIIGSSQGKTELMTNWKVLDLLEAPQQRPEFHLAMEDILLNEGFSSPLLILYENPQCVVMGKNQNPWREVDIAYMEKHGIPLLRRKTGGGSVFHGKGNILFCFIERSDSGMVIPMNSYNKILINCLNQLGFPVEENERNCLFFKENKISGNAQAIRKGISLSHGTLLVNAELDFLSPCLHSTGEMLNTKAISSVKNEVGNLLDKKFEGKERTDFKKSLVNELVKELGATKIEFSDLDISNEKIRNTAQHYESWSWTYGKTPPFTQPLKDLLKRDVRGMAHFKNAVLEKILFKKEVNHPKKRLKYGSKELFAFLEKILSDENYQLK